MTAAAAASLNSYLGGRATRAAASRCEVRLSCAPRLTGWKASGCLTEPLERSPGLAPNGTRPQCPSYLTCAASRDRVPVRCGMPLVPTPSQGRAGAIYKWCAERLHPLAQRALVLALTGVGEWVDPHGR